MEKYLSEIKLYGIPKEQNIFIRHNTREDLYRILFESFEITEYDIWSIKTIKTKIKINKK